jgi:hypothetical protein
MFGFGMVTVAGAWCYYSWRSILISGIVFVPILAFALAVNNDMLPLPASKLPMIMQRSLSFIPADWDEEATRSGKDSNDFRDGIEQLYLKEYLWRSPWIGTGYNIDSEEFDELNEGLMTGRYGRDSFYFLYKMYIVGKMFHTGWLSVYDIVGIIGFAAFLFLAASEIWTLWGWIFDPKADRRSSLFPLYVWLFVNTVTMMLSFFTVFGDFAITFGNLVLNAMAISLVTDARKISDAPLATPERRITSDITRTSEGRYGYQTRY